MNRKTILYALVSAHLVNDLYATVLPAFLPAVADEFDLDYTELGILAFAFTLLTGVSQPLLGSFADRKGKRRWVLVGGFMVAAGGFLAMAVAPSFWFIVLVSTLVGLGAATYHPQATAFIISAYPDRRGRMLGIFGWGGSAGHFLAPVMVVMAVALFDWRVAMALIAIPMVITALILRTKLPETEPSPGVTMRGALTRPLLLAAVTFAMIGLVGRSFLNFFVKMLVDEGWAETNAGLLLTVILMGGAISQPLGGLAYDRFGGRAIATTAAAVTAALIGVFSLTDGAVSIFAVAGIAFFHFSLFPVGLAQASELAASAQTGAATGIMFGVSGLMSATAQPIVGVVAEAAGDIRVALVWLLPFALLGIFLARFIPAASVQMEGVEQGEPTAV
ncbi:MAG: FSR family fosmidomycin resistance protein-like MFS transporter [Verrucomicrobiales bacterium]|jgi:FSR family fosmidomycin resistance protein-like MFS transporter